MRILTIGAGTVGTWIADMLCRQRHDVTVLDINPERVRKINAELDVRAMQGSGSQSSVLFQAGVMNADLCLAMTGDDEVNLVAASMAKSMGATRSIARVYEPVFRDLSTFDYEAHFGIDRLISLEHLTALELALAIRNPGSLFLENLMRGQLEGHDVAVAKNAANAGIPLKDLQLPSGVRIGTIQRGDRTWIPGAGDQLQANDRILIIGRSEEIERIRSSFDTIQVKKQTVVIAGGGECGFHLARALERERFDVLLIERDSERCGFLAANLGKATVIRGDVTLRAVLEEERVGACDFFIACTGVDENNIMAGVEAKELGAKKIMSVVGRPDYANVVEKLGIDLAVSERDVMAKQIQTMLTEGPVLAQKKLPKSNIQMIEMKVEPDSIVSQKPLSLAGLPAGTLVAATVRDDFVKVPTASDSLVAGSTVLLLTQIEDANELVPWFKTVEETEG